MSKTEPKTIPPTRMAEPADGWPADEFTGHAGRYVRDPITGVRRKADDDTPTHTPTPTTTTPEES